MPKRNAKNLKLFFLMREHSIGHSSPRKQPIQEGDMPFESPKCPLKSGLINFLKN
jgi:hypothetical protein